MHGRTVPMQWCMNEVCGHFGFDSWRRLVTIPKLLPQFLGLASMISSPILFLSRGVHREDRRRGLVVGEAVLDTIDADFL